MRRIVINSFIKHDARPGSRFYIKILNVLLILEEEVVTGGRAQGSRERERN